MYDIDNSRIYFKDSPYPKGHKLKGFRWTAQHDPESGVLFHFHLETENYYAEDDSQDPDDFEPESDWKAKGAWGNFHSCIISSDYWHFGGFYAGKTEDQIDFSNFPTFHVDPLPRADDFDIEEDRPFAIYLLGHDDCADHKISFKKNDNGNYDIDWSGKIALAYIGDMNLNIALMPLSTM